MSPDNWFTVLQSCFPSPSTPVWLKDQQRHLYTKLPELSRMFWKVPLFLIFILGLAPRICEDREDRGMTIQS
jgi:hypothetical protein